MQTQDMGGTLVSRTARALTDLSLSSEEGGFLGAEGDLLSRLEVSRPTLRQAAKIVENDRMISVRRGKNGGFFASRPDAEDAIRTLARFLRLKGATLGHIMVASRAVSQEAAVLASRCEDECLRSEMVEFAAKIESNQSPGALIKAENVLAGLIARMSGNPAIELLMAIGYSFGMEEQEFAIFEQTEQREQVRKLQADVCRAILDGDPELSRLMMQRRSQLISSWLEKMGVSFI